MGEELWCLYYSGSGRLRVPQSHAGPTITNNNNTEKSLHSETSGACSSSPNMTFPYKDVIFLSFE